MKNWYKLLNRWYYTPSRLTKTNQNASDICWWCGKLGANFWHVWWSWTKITRFGKQVCEMCQWIIGKGFLFHSRVLLLGDMNVNVIYKCKALIILLRSFGTAKLGRWGRWPTHITLSLWHPWQMPTAAAPGCLGCLLCHFDVACHPSAIALLSLVPGVTASATPP